MVRHSSVVNISTGFIRVLYVARIVMTSEAVVSNSF